MTSSPAPPSTTRRLRDRPSAALVRAGSVGGGGALLAVLVGRPLVLLVVVPLLVWAFVAVLRRDPEGVPSARVAASRRIVEEGSSVAVDVRTGPGVLTAVTVPLTSHSDLTPPHGSLAGDGAVRIAVRARRWGRIAVGPLHVLASDPLGASRAQVEVAPVHVQVLPDASVLEAPVEVPTPIGVSGVHLSRRRGDGTALAEVRAFRPGDRLHRVNWRVTSRTGTLHTNATFTEQDTDVLIVTDTIADVLPAPWAGPDAPSSLDVTVRATAAVARHYLTAGDRVGVFDVGHLLGPVRPGTGPRQLRVLTDALSRAARDTGAPKPARRLRTVRPGTLVVFCSPLLAVPAIEQIGVLVAHGADVVVVDTLPASVGDTSVLHGRPLAVDGRASERFWAEAWALRRLQREETVRELRESGVPVTPWEGPSSLAPVLLSLTAARTAPRRRRS